jgi:hypothetical protein
MQKKMDPELANIIAVNYGVIYSRTESNFRTKWKKCTGLENTRILHSFTFKLKLHTYESPMMPMCLCLPPFPHFIFRVS